MANFDVEACPFREEAHDVGHPHLRECRLEHLRQQSHLPPDLRVVSLTTNRPISKCGTGDVILKTFYDNYLGVYSQYFILFVTYELAP